MVISLEQFWNGIIIFYALPKVLYYNCVKLHQYWFIPYKTDRQTDGQTDS